MNELCVSYLPIWNVALLWLGVAIGYAWRTSTDYMRRLEQGVRTT